MITVDELLLRVFSNLTLQELGRAAQVCRGWCAVADDDALWQVFCAAKGIGRGRGRWKETYVASPLRLPPRIFPLVGDELAGASIVHLCGMNVLFSSASGTMGHFDLNTYKKTKIPLQRPLLSCSSWDD